MEELFFYPVRRPWRASGFARRRLSSRKIVLEMLEASGKRVYSAREIQPVRWLRGRMSRSGEGRAGASIRTTGNGRNYPYEELENPCNQGRSEEHTSELQSLMRTSYAVFCLKKKKTNRTILRKKSSNAHNKQ